MTQQYKVLSLLEPWATLKAYDLKRIETRSWATTYRGPIFIHASKGYGKEQKYIAHTKPFRTSLETVNYAPERTLGHIIAQTEILDVVPITDEFASSLTANERLFGDYTPGRYA